MLISMNVEKINNRLRQSVKTTALSILCLSITSVAMADNVYKVTEHVIQKDETLGYLSLKYNTSINSIKRINKLSDDDDIKAGDRILVPLNKTVTSPKTVKTLSVKKSVTKRKSPTANKKYTTKKYQVQAGDILTKIAVKNHISLSKLLDANNLDDPNYQLWTGETLYIPVTKTKTKAKSRTRSSKANKKLLKKGSTFKPKNVTLSKIEAKKVQQYVPSASIKKNVLQRNAKNQVVYAVVEGDTLSDIAKRFKTTQENLIKLNNFHSGDFIEIGTPIIIRDNNKMASKYAPEITFVSEKYAIPTNQTQQKSKTTANKADTEEVKTVASQQDVIIQDSYTVQEGDSLTSIANHLNTSTKSIIELNSLKNANSLKVGQVLTVQKNIESFTPSEEESNTEEAVITDVTESGTY